jgi:hypothetical protein
VYAVYSLSLKREVIESMEPNRILGKGLPGGNKDTGQLMLNQLQESTSERQAAEKIGGISYDTVCHRRNRFEQEGQPVSRIKRISRIVKQAKPEDHGASKDRAGTKRYTGEGLEYHNALQIVEYFRKALADLGYLGLSDHDMLEATKKALKSDVKDSHIAASIKGWLDGEFRHFKPGLRKAFGDDLLTTEPTIEATMKHYKKAELLEKTYETIGAFHQQLADFGWSALRFKDVFEAAKVGLKINFFGDATGEIDDRLQPIAWHIHVLLQEAEYAHLKPILEAGLKSTAKEVFLAAARATKAKNGATKKKEGTKTIRNNR